MMDLPRSPSPELDFVVRASAPAPGVLHADDLDWDAVRTHALHQRVLPRVWRNAAALVPATQAAAFQRIAASNAQLNLRFLARTIEVVQLLASAGIEVIVLKGPVLAHQLYGDYGLRMCVDVDVLVKPGELPAAARLLAKARYRHHTPLDDDSLRRHGRLEHDVAFVHPEDDTLIELHSDLAQPYYSYRLPLDEWWRQRQRVHAGGGSLAVLSDQHAFLLGVLHGAKHRWHRLDLIADTTAQAALPLDWRAVEAEARATGMTRVLRTALALTAHFYGPVSPKNSVLVRKLASHTLAGADPSRWAGVWLDLQLRERLADRARYAWGRAVRSALHPGQAALK